MPDHGDDKPTTPPPEQGQKEGMSGIGIFFTLILVLAAVYFIGGAFYNFKMYNARGLDLIPHRGKKHMKCTVCLLIIFFRLLV